MANENTPNDSVLSVNPFTIALLALARASVPEDHLPAEHMDDDDRADDRQTETWVTSGEIRAARRALASMGFDKDGNALSAPQPSHAEAGMSDEYLTVVLRLPANQAQRTAIVKSFDLFVPGGYMGAECTAASRGDVISQLEALEARR